MNKQTQMGQVRFEVRRKALLLREFTVADVVDSTGLNPESIRTEIQRLKKEGFLYSQSWASTPKGPGKPPSLYKLTDDPQKRLELSRSIEGFIPSLPEASMPTSAYYKKAKQLIQHATTADSSELPELLRDVERNLDIAEKIELAGGAELLPAYFMFERAKVSLIKGDVDEAVGKLLELRRDFSRVHNEEMVTQVNEWLQNAHVGQQPQLELEWAGSNWKNVLLEALVYFNETNFLNLFLESFLTDKETENIARRVVSSGLLSHDLSMEEAHLLSGISRDVLSRANEEVLKRQLGQRIEALYGQELLQDITKEHLERLNNMKTDFITVAGHELRTPLAQIRGFTDIMEAMNEQGILDQDQMSGMTMNLRKAADRLENLIGAMLDVSPPDVNAIDLRFSQTSVENCIRTAIEPLTESVKQRKLMLSASGLRALPPIQADTQRLVKAFRNVVLNAIKYTPDGGRIDISGQLQDDDVVITIKDSGIGIAKENRELIFEKFFRAHDPSLHSSGATKFMGAGSGLGLTIARAVITAHSGKIWVESPGYDPELYPGTTVHISLPLSPPEDDKRGLPIEGEVDFDGGGKFPKFSIPDQSR